MKLKKYIEAVINYIEEHIQEDLSVDQISHSIGYSKFYLHRIFQIYTGLSIKAYVRKRKMYHALVDLQTELRVIDIALKYGYASERSFTRAFTNMYGKSPSHFRNVDYLVEEKLCVYDLELPERDWVNKVKEYLSSVRYETLEPMTVISGKRAGLEPEDEIIGVMSRYAEGHNIVVKRRFGFDSPVSEDMQAKGQRGYEYWLVVNDDYNLISSEFVLKKIPSYKYVSLRIENPFENPMEKIPNGWKTLVAWLDSNVEDIMSKDLCLDCLEEEYEKDGINYMDIFIPIAKG